MALFGNKKKKDTIVKRKHNLAARKPARKSEKRNNTIHRGSQKKSAAPNLSKLVNFFFDFNIKHDNRIFFVFLIILTIGIIAIFASTIVFAYRYTGDKYYYLFSQLKLIGIGFVLLAVFYFVRIEFITKLWIIPFIVSIFLLAYLLFLAYSGKIEATDGATRWLQLGGFTFQPSDFAKLAFVIFIAAFLSRLPESYRNTKEFVRINFIPFCICFFLIVGLVLLGRNLGTAMVIGFIGLVCYWASATTSLQKAGFTVLIAIVIIGGIGFGIYENYRADRIAVWTNYLKTGDTEILEADGKLSRDQRSYQFDQVLTACGSGGIMGTGLGQSIGKYYFVKTTAGDDSIICIVGEELGFGITAIILMLYLYLVYVCLSLARDFWNKPVYYYLLIAIASWIGFQMFVHVGANIGVIPLTGQTLPFVSLGGSSLISLMAAMGIILNISKQPKKVEEDHPKRKAFI